MSAASYITALSYMARDVCQAVSAFVAGAVLFVLVVALVDAARGKWGAK